MPEANEMLQNDPVVAFLFQRLHLTPFEVAIVTLLLLPVVLLLWCWWSGTLRISASMTNPGGHGFLSPINAYLLVVPVLNFAVFEYYEVYSSTIQNLYNNHIIAGKPDDIFSVLRSGPAKTATVVSFSVSLTLALASVVWNRYLQKPKQTNWVCRIGSPRPVGLYFLSLFFFVELAILFNWFLRNSMIWRKLNEKIQNASTQPFSPDHMLGLSGVSVLAEWSFIVIALISILVILWIVGARITLKKSNLYANPAYMLAALAIVMLGPIAVIAPLSTSHKVMTNARGGQLKTLSDQIQIISKDIEAHIDEPTLNESQLGSLLKKLDAENRLYDFVKNSSTWPISDFTLGSFPVAFLSPVFVPLFVEIGKRYVFRWFR